VDPKILKHGSLNLKPSKSSSKYKPKKRSCRKPTSNYQIRYDPIDRPFASPKSPQRKSADVVTHADVSKYDPVDRPFIPIKLETTTPNTSSKSTKKHPFVYGAILIAILLPFIILVANVIGPIGEIFRDFQDFMDSARNDPSLTHREFIDLLNEFFERRQNR